MDQLERILTRAHGLNYATTRLDVLANGIALSHGTAFVLRYRHHYALVTAWHVLTGRNAITGKVMGEIRPDTIRFQVSLEDQDKFVGYDKHERYRKTVELALYDDHDTPIWTELSGRPYQVDVALILLDDKIPEIKAYGGLDHFNTAQRNERDVFNRGGLYPSFEEEELLHLMPRIRSDVHILGYPQSIQIAEGFPIWKRASIASEPNAAVISGGMTNSEIFFADGLTKSGMSGAPVIYIGEEEDPMWTLAAEFYNLEFSGPHLVGVYAGRDGSTKDENEFAMARVWKAQLLVELFQNCLRAKGLERYRVVDDYYDDDADG